MGLNQQLRSVRRRALLYCYLPVSRRDATHMSACKLTGYGESANKRQQAIVD